MRDIRKDLQERLSEIEGEREVLQRRLETLSKKETTLKALLEDEERQWARLQSKFHELEITTKLGKRSRLRQFLLDTLNDGRAWTLGDLKTVAEEQGITLTGKSLGRVLHFALVGMRVKGLVEMVDKGIWKLKEPTSHQQVKGSNGG